MTIRVRHDDADLDRMFCEIDLREPDGPRCGVCGAEVDVVSYFRWWDHRYLLSDRYAPTFLPGTDERMCSWCAFHAWFRCACCRRLVREFCVPSTHLVKRRTNTFYDMFPIVCRRTLCQEVGRIWEWGWGCGIKGWVAARWRAIDLAREGMWEWAAIAILVTILKHESAAARICR